MSFPGLKSKDKLLFGEEVTIKKHSLKDKVPGEFISNPPKKKLLFFGAAFFLEDQYLIILFLPLRDIFLL